MQLIVHRLYCVGEDDGGGSGPRGVRSDNKSNTIHWADVKDQNRGAVEGLAGGDGKVESHLEIHLFAHAVDAVSR